MAAGAGQAVLRAALGSAHSPQHLGRRQHARVRLQWHGGAQELREVQQHLLWWRGRGRHALERAGRLGLGGMGSRGKELGGGGRCCGPSGLPATSWPYTCASAAARTGFKGPSRAARTRPGPLHLAAVVAGGDELDQPRLGGVHGHGALLRHQHQQRQHQRVAAARGRGGRGGRAGGGPAAVGLRGAGSSKVQGLRLGTPRSPQRTHKPPPVPTRQVPPPTRSSRRRATHPPSPAQPVLPSTLASPPILT